MFFWNSLALVAQRLKHLPPVWETLVRSLGQEYPLEKEMVTHSSILAWSIPWTEKTGRLQSTGLQKVGHDWATSLSLSGCGQLISGSSAFSKSSLNIWEFLVQVLLKPSLENFEHYFASMWDECNCAVVWTFFSTALLWDWNENWSFPVLWPLLRFPNMLVYWVQHYNIIIF